MTITVLSEKATESLGSIRKKSLDEALADAVDITDTALSTGRLQTRLSRGFTECAT